MLILDRGTAEHQHVSAPLQSAPSKMEEMGEKMER